ncbi:mammalian ependymin-related protein 1-like [Mytilus trossulus]|uniref:mammalian ependymin-related protein 1-like n=1 Tax=Mytilus trossulus TaxID=6551 RepID=UPI0030044E33
MKLLLLALCCLVVVYAQVPRPCESPKQWEGRFLRADRAKSFGELAKLSYDETNRRAREIEEVQFGQDREYYDVLYLHNIGKEYRLNLKTRKCNVTSLLRPFRPYGVPPNAQFDGSATIGAAGVPGESLVVENWSLTDGNDKFYGMVSSPDCVPIEYAFYSQESSLITTTFFDINVGITDPNVFIPPSECSME